MNKKVELLAPAGSWEAFLAAINNGADAVYLGGKNFSARAFANNFDHEQLIKAVNYAHILNVKIYVTLNTLITDFEFDNVKKEIDFLYSINVDALIIQDLGVYYYVKEKYPDFELHASTQMHAHNLNGVRTCQELGFKRVVVARESSLEFITEACKQNIEIETFVHGAICVSYSGQCLMSSVTKSRSANKGMCAQCCRLAYDLKDLNSNLDIETDTKYLLSPKDMMLINKIPDLINAGVTSFKIEGRMKSSAYVGYVTRIYRKAIDSYYKNVKYMIDDQELKNFKYLFNRNFTNSYLLNDNNNLFGQDKPNHLGNEIGRVIKVSKDSIFVRLIEDLNQYDGIRIVSGNREFGQIVNFLSFDGKYVNKVSKGCDCEIKCKDNVKYNDIVYKTIDFKLEDEIANTVIRKNNINIEVYVNSESKISLYTYNEYFSFKYESNIQAQMALNAPVDKENFLKHFSFGESLYKIIKCDYKLDNIFIPVKQINELKHSFIEKLNNYLLNSFKRNITSPKISLSKKFNNNIDFLNNIDDIEIINPVINTDNIYKEGDINLISEIGGLLLPYSKKVGSYTLNIANSYAYEFLIRLGFDAIMISTELNKLEIEELINSYNKRNKTIIHPIILSNTCRPLMYLRRNPFKTYVDNVGSCFLTDGTNKYLIVDNKSFIEIKEVDKYDKKAIFKGFKHISLS